MYVQTSKRHQQGASLTQRYNEADSINNTLIRMHIAHMYTRGSVTEFVDRSLSEGSLTSSSSPAFLFPSVLGPPGKTWKHLSVSHAANLNCLSLCMSEIPQTFDSCDANQMLRNLMKPDVLNILSALTSLSAMFKYWQSKIWATEEDVTVSSNNCTVHNSSIFGLWHCVQHYFQSNYMMDVNAWPKCKLSALIWEVELKIFIKGINRKSYFPVLRA